MRLCLLIFVVRSSFCHVRFISEFSLYMLIKTCISVLQFILLARAAYVLVLSTVRWNVAWFRSGKLQFGEKRLRFPFSSRVARACWWEGRWPQPRRYGKARRHAPRAFMAMEPGGEELTHRDVDIPSALICFMSCSWRWRRSPSSQSHCLLLLLLSSCSMACSWQHMFPLYLG